MTMPPPATPDHWSPVEKVAFRDGFEKGVAAALERAADEARVCASPVPLPRMASLVIASTLAGQAAVRLGTNQRSEWHLNDAEEIVRALFEGRSSFGAYREVAEMEAPHVVIFEDGSLGNLNRDCDRARRA